MIGRWSEYMEQLFEDNRRCTKDNWRIEWTRNTKRGSGARSEENATWETCLEKNNKTITKSTTRVTFQKKNERELYCYPKKKRYSGMWKAPNYKFDEPVKESDHKRNNGKNKAEDSRKLRWKKVFVLERENVLEMRSSN